MERLMKRQTRRLVLNIVTGIAIAAAAAVVLTPASAFTVQGAWGAAVSAPHVAVDDGSRRDATVCAAFGLNDECQTYAGDVSALVALNDALVSGAN
jgi:hypothetical protein